MSNGPGSGGGRRGRGVCSPDPYPLGSLSEAPNQNLVAGQSGQAECDSAWSGEHTPRPRRPPPASRTSSLSRPASPREPHVPEVVEVRITHLDPAKPLAVRL